MRSSRADEFPALDLHRAATARPRTGPVHEERIRVALALVA